MQIQMYVYTNKLPSDDLTLFRCIKCTRTLFRANADKILMSNAYGASYADLPPSSVIIEHQCHSCKTMYFVLFQ